jgi:DNA-binding transcriptional regulator YdaS (Cro superfamily)
MTQLQGHIRPSTPEELMPQISNPRTTAELIEGTNFDPREWSAMASLQQDQGKQFGQKEFEEFLETYDLTRKKFCSIFGIAESTLSGWLSGKGIPATTVIAIELAQELDIRLEQLRQMASALDAAEYDMRVVRDGETYTIVQFPFSGNEGMELARQHRQPVGSIVARGIPDRTTALSLVRSQSLVRTLERVRGELVNAQPRTEHFGGDYRREVLMEVEGQLNWMAETDGSEG